MGNVPLRCFRRYLNNNLIRNTAASSTDARRGELAHGKEVIKLRSSSTKIKSKTPPPIASLVSN